MAQSTLSTGLLLNILRFSTSGEGLSRDDFEVLFKEQYPLVRNFLYYKTADMEMAEDLAQDAFIKLWETRQSVRKESLKSFLYTIANNMTINQLKRQQLRFRFINRQDANFQDDKTPEFLAEEREFQESLELILAESPKLNGRFSL